MESSTLTTTCTFRNFSQTICENSVNEKLGTEKDIVFCFDVDGVFLRGKYPIKQSMGALKLLNDHQVDYIFLTNNCSRSETDFSQHLSDVIQHPIDSRLMFMAQTPLRMHKELHNKRMLAIGYRNEYSVLQSVGFTNVITVKDFCESYDNLLNCEDESQIASGIDQILPIEGIIILEEPKGWEISIQTIIDLIVTSGDLSLLQKHTFQECIALDLPPLPIYAICTDFLTKSENPWPRLSIGAFLHFLDEAYQKLTGRTIVYERVYGKPNDETYVYLRRYLKELYGKDYKKMYFVGDNLLTDVYGANSHRSCDSLDRSNPVEITTCFVHTGVHAKNWHSDPSHVTGVLSLLHRTTKEVNEKFLYPDIEADNVTTLVTSVLKLEGL